MEADTNSRESLLQEIQSLKRQAAEADELRGRLEAAQDECRELADRLEEADRTCARECTEKSETLEALHLAQVIIDNSPVILFRRVR
jgi:hypothetical protein